MREPSDIAVGGREFYVCDFKVTRGFVCPAICICQLFLLVFVSTDSTVFVISGPQCGSFHRGGGLCEEVCLSLCLVVCLIVWLVGLLFVF